MPPLGFIPLNLKSHQNDIKKWDVMCHETGLTATCRRCKKNQEELDGNLHICRLCTYKICNSCDRIDNHERKHTGCPFQFHKANPHLAGLTGYGFEQNTDMKTTHREQLSEVEQKQSYGQNGRHAGGGRELELDDSDTDDELSSFISSEKYVEWEDKKDGDYDPSESSVTTSVAWNSAAKYKAKTKPIIKQSLPNHVLSNRELGKPQNFKARRNFDRPAVKNVRQPISAEEYSRQSSWKSQ
jgi:hypothetical protein